MIDKKYLLICVLTIPTLLLSSQSDSSFVKNEKVEFTFLGTRLVNGQSTEIAGKGELNFMINHRFGLIRSGLYEFWGLDQAEIRLGLDYGITDFLAVGFGRNSFQKTYDLKIKYKILSQYKDGFPITVTGFSGFYYNTTKDIFPKEKDNLGGRTSYLNQILISHKFSQRFSILSSAGWLHESYNLLLNKSHDYLVFGGGGRIKILKRLHFTIEYYHIENKHENTVNPLSLGLEIDTGGHLFQLNFSNSQATFSKSLLADTVLKWKEDNVFFGFNLIRTFYIN